MDSFDLGAYRRPISTRTSETQRWFDMGLNWCYGYHHEEAVACFEKALAADPNCAMAHWGIGYAAGPNYNFPWELMDPAGKAAALGRAHDAAQAALALAGHTTAPERAMIEALPARYARRARPYPRRTSPVKALILRAYFLLTPSAVRCHFMLRCPPVGGWRTTLRNV